LKIYEEINTRDSLKGLAYKYDVSYNTLLSIYSQKSQDQTRATMNIHRSLEKIRLYYDRCVISYLTYKRYSKGEDIVAIAESISLAPCLLARYIIKQFLYLSTDWKEEKNDRTLKAAVSRMIKDPMKIPNERLRDQIKQ
jgi:hypothetical protein